MRKNGKLLKSKARFQREEVATLLEDLAVAIRAGSLTLGAGKDRIEMDLPETVTVEMEVQDSGKRRLTRELELEIEWAIEDDGTPVAGADPRSGFVVG